jgi:hypothetical protein
MYYRLFRLSDGGAIDALEAHVLARAYDAAWQALYLCEPVGEHVITSLGVAIDFGPSGTRRT